MRRDYSVGRLRAQICRRANLLVQFWAVCFLAWTAGCSVDSKLGIQVDGQVAVGGSDGGSLLPDVPIISSFPDARISEAGVVCSTNACGTETAQRCGDFVDDCGQVQHCGVCLGGAPCVNNVCVGACQGCSVPGGDYCGEIGDNCGGTLKCPTTCSKYGWTCEKNICKAQPPFCTLVTCATASGDHYCGKIGNGCGDSVDCGNDCPTGWDCVDHICVGSPVFCPPLTCLTTSGDHYCGTVGNGCGGKLECGEDCPVGWKCEDNHVCKGEPPICTPLICTAASGDHYCGTMGDGCGGTLNCGDNCLPGWTCGADHICKGDLGVCTPVSCVAPSGDHYCGTIGDTCGNSLDCGPTCATAGWTCQHNVCRGDFPICSALTSCLVASSGDSYCGPIGDGCGGTLPCPPTCLTANWVCEDRMCKGHPPYCTPKTCTAVSGDQYCDIDIGDGCGASVHCGPTCSKTGWACGGDHICKGGPDVCTPLACLTANDDQYCGVVGDGCGGQVDCGSTCKNAGWLCETGLCRGPKDKCTPISCKPAEGGQYCGIVGDRCGHPLNCGTDCSAAGASGDWVCGTKSVCVGGPTCKKLTCNPTEGGQYCGDIGDGCGGSLSCPTTCPVGTTCNAAHVCACDNLCLKRVTCDGGATTSISGTVYDPAGLNPLYNVIVSIPNTALDPITTGATCASCDAQVSGQPIAAALTDATGHFVLNNVPWGTDFPLVMQLGKWRRQITIAATMVTHQCADNPITDNPPDAGTLPDKLLRLPRNIHDGDNNGQYTSIPKIAIAGGNAHPDNDPSVTERLQCLLRRIGVDASEFALPTGSGSIHFYNQTKDPDTCNQVAGSTTTYPDATTNLWDTQAHLNKYDVILLNCGGNQNGVDPTTTAGQAFIPNPAAVDRMKAYVNGGGRVFAEHYEYAWIHSFTNYLSTFGEVATWYPLPQTKNKIGTASRDTFIDQSFPKGVAFARWLTNVGASTTNGHLSLSSGAKFTAIDQINPPSQRWIYEPANAAAPTGAAVYTHYFSFNTPLGAAEAAQCGKFVYTALHVSDSASTGFPGDPATSSGAAFPGCCSPRTELSAQEKALEFMFFDLSSCVTTVKLPDPPGSIAIANPPAPPPPPPPPAAPPAPPPPGAPAPPPPDIPIIP